VSLDPTFMMGSSALRQSDSAYPQIQNVTVNVSQSGSATIFVPVDNLGSPFNWTGLRLSYLSPVNGIKITKDPLLFVDAFVQAHSNNYSLKIGISAGGKVSLGSYTIPFVLTARSSTLPPYTSTSVNFNVIINVIKFQPAPFPIIFLYLAVAFISAVTMIGTILVWSRNWNISEIKK
jgi:hypothetical protein